MTPKEMQSLRVGDLIYDPLPPSFLGSGPFGIVVAADILKNIPSGCDRRYLSTSDEMRKGINIVWLYRDYMSSESFYSYGAGCILLRHYQVISK